MQLILEARELGTLGHEVQVKRDSICDCSLWPPEGLVMFQLPRDAESEE